jgi:aminoglycoside 6'-N-acetyltransferase I
MIVRNVEPQETEAWLALRMALWPQTDAQQHRQEMAMMLSDTDRLAVFVAEDPKGSLVGFAEASLRDWAEGCTSSPVGYLEGWFVVPRARRQGVGAALLAAAEDWARAHDCTEMASDTELENEVSEAAHRKLGYRVTARVVAFRKALG